MYGARNGRTMKSRDVMIGFAAHTPAPTPHPSPGWGASPNILAPLRGADGAVKQGR
jgi:hypothetical protein